MISLEKSLLVSCIIPTYNDWSCLKIALDSLAKQTYPQLEVIVIDDAGFDETESIIFKLYPKIIYEKQSVNQGAYMSRQRGIALAHGEILLFTDNDCCFDVHWVQQCVDNIQRGQQVVTGPVWHGQPLKSQLIAITCFGEYQDDFKKVMTGFCTANVAIQKSLFEKYRFPVGIRFGGDRLLSWQMYQDQIKIYYDPKCYVYHLPKDSWTEIFHRAWRYGTHFFYLRHQEPSLPGAQLAKLSFLAAFPLMLIRWGMDIKRFICLKWKSLYILWLPVFIVLTGVFRMIYGFGVFAGYFKYSSKKII